MTEDQKLILIKAQQGELDGVETYLMLADTVHNESDRKAFKLLAADEGRHASVFRQYTSVNLTPRKLQARAVVILYHLLGKRILYPIIARFEYAAIPGYEQLEADFPMVESVKNDEKHHGDTLRELLGNGEYADKAKGPFVTCAFAVFLIIRRFMRQTDK